MYNMLRSIYQIFKKQICPYPKWYLQDLQLLLKQKQLDSTFPIGNRFPILHERTDEGGTMKGHYFHQDLYVARLIYEAKPQRHLDIGSRTDGFVAHVATYREIEIIDIRPIKSKVRNIVFRQADLMQLPQDLVGYCDSVSSLHAIEHFGLGRYGDPINYFGYLEALNNIYLILKPGGTFYFSVPIGTQRIEFNAHRVFSVKYLVDLFGEKYQLEAFSYVNDQGDFVENALMNDQNINSNFGCEYGCGIFTLRKK
jgi:SAM-dependent methyltransferase